MEAGKHLQHAGQWPPRTKSEKHCCKATQLVNVLFFQGSALEDVLLTPCSSLTGFYCIMMCALCSSFEIIFNCLILGNLQLCVCLLLHSSLLLSSSSFTQQSSIHEPSKLSICTPITDKQPVHVGFLWKNVEKAIQPQE